MIFALVMMAVIQTSILACLYQGCGEIKREDFGIELKDWKILKIRSLEALYDKLWDDNRQAIVVYVANWLGLVTLMSSDQFIMCGFAIVVSVA